MALLKRFLIIKPADFTLSSDDSRRSKESSHNFLSQTKIMPTCVQFNLIFYPIESQKFQTKIRIKTTLLIIGNKKLNETFFTQKYPKSIEINPLVCFGGYTREIYKIWHL
jgi:hypothetical protein